MDEPVDERAMDRIMGDRERHATWRTARISYRKSEGDVWFRACHIMAALGMKPFASFLGVSSRWGV